MGTEGRMGSAIAGVLNIILGLLILGNPMLGIVMLVYLAAILNIVGGIATIYLAIKMRSDKIICCALIVARLAVSGPNSFFSARS